MASNDVSIHHEDSEQDVMRLFVSGLNNAKTAEGRKSVLEVHLPKVCKKKDTALHNVMGKTEKYRNFVCRLLMIPSFFNSPLFNPKLFDQWNKVRGGASDKFPNLVQNVC